MRRVAIRAFFLAFVAIVAIDTAPATWKWLQPAKQTLSPLLRRVGLWQGQWTLFAPNPTLNNAWLSAEVFRPDGTQEQIWNSAYWAKTNGWERFVGFRRMNYAIRMAAVNPSVANDLCDYLARQLIASTARPIAQPIVSGDASQPPAGAADTAATRDLARPWKIVLSRNQMSIVLPADGTLPKRDETISIASSKNLAVREYRP